MDNCYVKIADLAKKEGETNPHATTTCSNEAIWPSAAMSEFPPLPYVHAHTGKRGCAFSRVPAGGWALFLPYAKLY